MKELSTLVLSVVALGSLAGPAVAQQQSWSAAIEQNPMLTSCGNTPNIPVAGASDCVTAKTAAWNLLMTLFSTPNCKSSGCPAGATITQGVSSCTPETYTRPNGSTAMRWQVTWTWGCAPPPSTSCQDDIKSGQLTITGPTVSNITASSALLTGSVSVAPIPSGCTYTAKLVWGPPAGPFPNVAATGSIPSTPLTLTGTASVLNPGSGYGARIEITKQCAGLAPTVCNGPTRVFETPKGEQGRCDLQIGKSLAHGIRSPLQTGQQAIFEIVVTNLGTGTCSAPISVTDNFSAGLTYVSGGTSGWVCPGGPITGASSTTCTNSQPLAPGQSSLLMVTYKVTAPPPNKIGNCASVKNPDDANPANNRVCIEVPVVETKPPDLTIKKDVSCSGPITSQGQKCKITFGIINNGPGTFNGILTVQDSMTPSPSVAWAGGSTPTSTPQGWGWSCSLPLPLGCATTGPVTLAPVTSTTVSVDVYIPTGQYKNCASVKGYTQFPYTSSTLVQEVTFGNNESCVPVKVGKVVVPPHGS